MGCECQASDILDSAENPLHEDQKLQTKWLKKNKRELAALCRGAVAIEPDTGKRLLKRAQGVAISTAFGLHFCVVPSRDEAEIRALRLLAGDNTADADGVPRQPNDNG